LLFGSKTFIANDNLMQTISREEKLSAYCVRALVKSTRAIGLHSMGKENVNERN
jgi:hypothetical protein